MSTHYLNPDRAHEPYYLPTLWVQPFGLDNPYEDKPEPKHYNGAPDDFEHDMLVWESEARECPCNHEDGGELDDHGQSCAGWYACVCIPGCMPDSSWTGPYPTEAAAVNGGRKLFGEESD